VALFPKVHEYLLPIGLSDNAALTYSGFFLLIVSLIWTVIAQSDMKNSWRIGIDTESKTELITTGLFSVSRNPIFSGMIFTLTGLFLVTPNALTLIFLILGYVLIQIQIRLEEEFLT
jgi:protein-S-isoprenylcysteine O-methyltransferase Ste14